MNFPLDSRQVRAFCVLARAGGFTQAARELHLTQSGVSHPMKALESDVGCRLLDRLGKKVVLTQAGEQFLIHAARILQEMENARESLAHLGKWGPRPVASGGHYNRVPIFDPAGASGIQGELSRTCHHD